MNWYEIKGNNASLFKNCLPASLFKKGLSENEATFEFEDLIPKPYSA